MEATKDCAKRAFEMGVADAGELQRSKFLEMAATHDHREALRAFLEKRTAVYHRR